MSEGKQAGKADKVYKKKEPSESAPKSEPKANPKQPSKEAQKSSEQPKAAKQEQPKQEQPKQEQPKQEQKGTKPSESNKKNEDVAVKGGKKERGPSEAEKKAEPAKKERGLSEAEKKAEPTKKERGPSEAERKVEPAKNKDRAPSESKKPEPKERTKSANEKPESKKDRAPSESKKNAEKPESKKERNQSEKKEEPKKERTQSESKRDRANSESQKKKKGGKKADDEIKNEAVSESLDDNGANKLETPWTFYFDKKLPPSSSKQEYEENLRKLGSFSTLEGFWRHYAWVKDADDIPKDHNLFLFRHNLVPAWETFPNGGCWIIKVRKRNGIISRLWEELCFAAVAELFEEPEVAGVVLSSRGRDDNLSVWNRDNSKFPEVRFRIGEKLRTILNLDESTKVEYKPFKAAIREGSTYRNAKAYVYAAQGFTTTASQGITPVLAPKVPVIPPPSADLRAVAPRPSPQKS